MREQIVIFAIITKAILQRRVMLKKLRRRSKRKRTFSVCVLHGNVFKKVRVRYLVNFILNSFYGTFRLSTKEII